MDYFAEYIVKRKKDLKDNLIVTGLIIAGVVLTPVFLSLRFLGSFSVLLAVGVWYGVYILVTSRNIEFEYAVTNGELDIDTIIAQRKRKRLLNVKSKEFELIAPVDDERFLKEFNDSGIKRVVYASGKIGNNTYFGLVRKNSELIKLIFEPSEKMLTIFKTYRPQAVFVRQEGEKV